MAHGDQALAAEAGSVGACRGQVGQLLLLLISVYLGLCGGEANTAGTPMGETWQKEEARPRILSMLHSMAGVELDEGLQPGIAGRCGESDV